jgi:hypothetical protein
LTSIVDNWQPVRTAAIPPREVTMRAKMPGAGPIERDTNSTRLREQAESTLNAIAGAIAAGRLPPDDAFAWARIAACEIKILRGRTVR